MKRLFLFLFALLCPVVAARAEQVTVLPEDGQYVYISLMGQPGEAKFEALKAGFLNKSTKLGALQDYTHVSILPTTEKMFQDRYGATVPSLPCLRVLNANGDKLYQESGAKMPGTVEAAASKITPFCPKPSPTPPPSVTPPPPTVTPDTPTPDTPESSTLPPWWAVLIAVMVGGGIGFVDYWNKNS